MSRYWSKSLCSKGGWVTLSANFRVKRASPTNDFWHQKPRVYGLSYGKKIAENFNRLSKAHQRHSQTDNRQTDGTSSRSLKTMVWYDNGITYLFTLCMPVWAWWSMVAFWTHYLIISFLLLYFCC